MTYLSNKAGDGNLTPLERLLLAEIADLGSPFQYLRVDSTGTGLEYATLSAGGSLTVTDGSTAVTDVTTINFTNGTVVTDAGSNEADVSITIATLTVTDGITTVSPTSTLTAGAQLEVVDNGGGNAQINFVPPASDGNIIFVENDILAGQTDLSWDYNNSILNVTTVHAALANVGGQIDYTNGNAAFVTVGNMQVGDSFDIVSAPGVPDAEFSQGAYISGGIWTAINDNPSKIVMYDGSVFLSTGYGTGIGNEPSWTDVLSMDGQNQRIGILNDTPQYTFDVNGDAHWSGALYDGADSPGDSSNMLVSTGTSVLWVTPISFGIPKTVATGDLTAQSAAVSSVVTTTVPNDGVNHTYSVGAYAAVTAISAGTLTVQYSFTDETNTVRTLNFFVMGLTSAGITGTGFDSFPAGTIRCKPNTAITVKTTFTGVSITYDVGGYITRIN